MQAERVIQSFGDKRKLVTNPDEEPFAAIAHLEHLGPIGTGFLSKIDDSFVVVTAGHCLQEKELNITFGDNSPTVKAGKETFGLPSKYKDCSPLDFGIILLKDQNYFKKKNVYLPLEIENGQRPVMMSGYPALRKAQYGVPGYPPKTQWAMEVTDCRADGELLRYRDATTVGNSGSPLFVKQNGEYVAVGIHIAGQEEINTGVRITKKVRDAICRLVETVKRRLKLEAKQVEQDKQLQKVKSTLIELADELDEQQMGIRIAKTSFASTGVVSTGAAIAGGLLVLFSGGGFLPLVVGGFVGGALSGAGTLATNVAENIVNSKKLKAAQEEIRKINASYSLFTDVEGETGGIRAATTGIFTMVGLFPPVLIGLNIAEIVSNSIKIDKKSPSEVAQQIRAIVRTLD